MNLVLLTACNLIVYGLVRPLIVNTPTVKMHCHISHVFFCYRLWSPTCDRYWEKSLICAATNQIIDSKGS